MPVTDCPNPLDLGKLSKYRDVIEIKNKDHKVLAPLGSRSMSAGRLPRILARGMESQSTVTLWEPPHRFAADSSDMGPEAPPIATEWIVEARAEPRGTGTERE